MRIDEIENKRPKVTQKDRVDLWLARNDALKARELKKQKQGPFSKAYDKTKRGIDDLERSAPVQFLKSVDDWAKRDAEKSTMK